jgi:hypothetical protein
MPTEPTESRRKVSGYGVEKPPTGASHAIAHRKTLGIIECFLAWLFRLFHRPHPAPPATETECPEPQRIAPGGLGPELHFDPPAFERLFVAAAREGNQGTQVWVKDNSELLVLTGKVSVRLDDGLLVVTVPVSCDQTGDVPIQVPFAVGGEGQPAGMIIATEARPRGPAEIVDLWGEALTAFAWRTLLAVTTQSASDSGEDADRAGLIPAALTASGGGLRLATMARHAFDRVNK